MTNRSWKGKRSGITQRQQSVPHRRKKRVLFAGKLCLMKFLKVGLALDFEFHGLGDPLEL